MKILSDEDIAALIAERKKFPAGLYPITKMTDQFQHKRKDFEVEADSGNEFVVAVRQSIINPLNFSVILGYRVPGFNTIFRLRRYNGNSHQHTNFLEKQIIDGFHVHTATERYQKVGRVNEDHYAETTNRYGHLDSAIKCLLLECGFNTPLEELPLFTGSLE
jgi:hypothetical protein